MLPFLCALGLLVSFTPMNIIYYDHAPQCTKEYMAEFQNYWRNCCVFREMHEVPFVFCVVIAGPLVFSKAEGDTRQRGADRGGGDQGLS